MRNNQKNRSPLIIGLLIGSFIIFLAWSAYQAATRGSEISDRDYYSKGLKYNTTLIEKRAASVLGWEFTVTLANHSLSITLTDGQQQPVTGGGAVIYLYQAAADAPHRFLLVENQPGSYQLDVPPGITGEHRARLDFVREGARISRDLLLNL